MKRRTFALLVSAMLISLPTLGCGGQDLGQIVEEVFPSIGPIVVGRAIHETPIEFSVETMGPENDESHLFVSEVLVAYRSMSAPDLPFIEVGELTDGTPSGDATSWTGTLPGLELGQYELRVQPRVKFQPQSMDHPPVDEQAGFLMVKTQVFWVGPGEGCFGFATDTEGWTVAGIFDIQASEGNPEGVLDTLPLQCTELLFLGGSALLPFGSACLPTTITDVTFALDFVSPDLSGLTEWQELERILFTIRADVPVRVQPILKFVDASGEAHAYAPQNGQDEWIFHAVDQSTSVIEWAPAHPSGSTITEFRVRVFIDPMVAFNSPEIFARLGAVCPVGP